MPSSSNNSSLPAVRILRIGMGVFALLGSGIALWITNQWIEHPEIRATQFGFEAPLWPAALVFVVAATIAGIGLLHTAAQRVRSGENLFDQRHRRHPTDAERESSRR